MLHQVEGELQPRLEKLKTVALKPQKNLVDQSQNTKRLTQMGHISIITLKLKREQNPRV